MLTPAIAGVFFCDMLAVAISVRDAKLRGDWGLVRTNPRKKMDYLWTPWRYHYVANAAADNLPDCIFCDAAKRKDDEKTLVVHRAVSSFVILNQYPYTSGHLMIVPYKHTAELSTLDPAALTEIMQLAQRCEAAFK